MVIELKIKVWSISYVSLDVSVSLRNDKPPLNKITAAPITRTAAIHRSVILSQSKFTIEPHEI